MITQDLILKHGPRPPTTEDFGDNLFTLGIDTSPRKFGPGNNGLALYMRSGNNILNVCSGYLEKDFYLFSVPIATPGGIAMNARFDEENGTIHYTKSDTKNFYGIITNLKSYKEEIKDEDDTKIGELVTTHYYSLSPTFNEYETTFDNDNGDDEYSVKPIRVFSYSPEYIKSLQKRISSLEERTIINQGSWS